MTLYLVHPTLAELIALATALTGRVPTPEEIAAARTVLRKVES